VPNCKSFLATEAERKHVSREKRELSSSFFLLQGKVPKETHVILTATLREHTPSYATFKNSGPGLNVLIFTPVMRFF
jgi:hypothetical protein